MNKELVKIGSVTAMHIVKKCGCNIYMFTLESIHALLDDKTLTDINRVPSSHYCLKHYLKSGGKKENYKP